MVRARIYRASKDFIDTDRDGQVREVYSGFRAKRGDASALSLPYTRVLEQAQKTGEPIVRQEELDHVQVGTLLARQHTADLADSRPVESLAAELAPFASTDELSRARWAFDTERHTLLFYTNDAPVSPAPRTSADFRSSHKILSESAILPTRMYSGWTGYLVDVNGDGRGQESSAGFRVTRSDEPALTIPYPKIAELAKRGQKEVLLDSELVGLQVGTMVCTRTQAIHRERRDVDSLAPSPARWAIDVSRGTLLFFND